MQPQYSRRQWLKGAVTVTSTGFLGQPLSVRAASLPAHPVAIARCETYDRRQLTATLDHMFDQLGGLGPIVKGKTVAVKINLTGAPTYRLGYLPLGDTHYTSPDVIAAVVHLMGKANAWRIRLLESPWSSAEPLEETLLLANWEPRDILSAAPRVEFENTNYLGSGKKYSRVKVPYGGYLFPAWDLNHSYEDCDVFVSLTKMKEHQTAGFTLSMKNCFGNTPASIYGGSAGLDEPNEEPKGGRGILHSGNRQPPKSAPPEKDPQSPRVGGYRIPRAVVDLVAARPVDLAIVDGIRTMAGGEGPWAPAHPEAIRPGVLFAGTNPVNTDAVGLALMGFDPQAARGTHPFETSDNMLHLAEEAGLGTADLGRIEVLGVPIEAARFDFARRRRTIRPL